MDVKKEQKKHSSSSSSKDKEKDKDRGESSSSSHHHHSSSSSRRKTSRRSTSPVGSSDDDHRHRSSHHSSHRDRDDKDKDKDKSTTSSRKKRHNDENQISEVATKKQKNSSSADTTTKDTNFEGGEKLELSIEETNKLREKLGLKPLEIDNKDQQKTTNNVSAEGNRIYHDKKTDETFEHVPAKNLSAIKEEKTIRDKLNEQREKRKLQEKIHSVKALGESDEENDDSAQKWVENLMKKQQEKEQAAKKAKMLEDMDQEIVANDSVQTKVKKEREKLNKYSSKDLSGLRVEHSQERFKEGESIVLTLKDKGVLDENEEDVLINVNIADDEKANKNIENKKKKSTYNPYDEFDEFGVWKDKNILEKYDEELDGEKKKSFKLGSGGVYDTSIDRFINEQNEEYKSRAVKLDLNDIKLASDYMTKEELESFKKPKKLRKKLRKTVKADDLLPLDEIEQASNSDEKNTNYGSRKTQQQNGGENGEEQMSTTTTSDAKQKEKISLKNIDFELKRRRKESENEDDEEIRLDNIDDKPIDDEAFDELHNVLEKIRKKKVKTNISQIVERIITEREDKEEMKQELERKISVNDEEDEGAQRTITLDATSEFCKNLGDIPSYSRKQTTKDEEFREVGEYMKKTEDEEEDNEMDRNSEDMDVDGSKKGSENDEEEDEELKPVFDDEPVIDRGLASAIRLAVNKGYLSEEKTLQNARFTKADSISAKHFQVEEKNFYDIDDKYTRNRGGGGGADRYSGPLVEFKEKEGYKPDVKLEYVDETGHRMNEKEAFRQLSHRFHGKGSGKRKTEKRNKKLKESELEKKMSSIDTPLNTVALLIEKQKKLQQPFVVLSAPKGERNDHITLNKP